MYPSIYSTQWDIIKEALLNDPKYVAVINNFCDNEEILSKIQVSYIGFKKCIQVNGSFENYSLNPL